jgi:Acyltransferase family
MVFFVLSGFWVGGAVLAKIRDGRFRVGGYARDRLVRLWLVLLPALALTAVLDLTGRWWFPASTIYSGDPEFHNVVPVSPAAMSVATALGNAAFLQHAWVPPFGTDTPLWSLAYEFWYYALFPCMVLLLRRSTPTRVRVTSAAALVAGGLVSGPQRCCSCFRCGCSGSSWRRASRRSGGCSPTAPSRSWLLFGWPWWRGSRPPSWASRCTDDQPHCRPGRRSRDRGSRVAGR